LSTPFEVFKESMKSSEFNTTFSPKNQELKGGAGTTGDSYFTFHTWAITFPPITIVRSHWPLFVFIDSIAFLMV